MKKEVTSGVSEFYWDFNGYNIHIVVDFEYIYIPASTFAAPEDCYESEELFHFWIVDYFLEDDIDVTVEDLYESMLEEKDSVRDLCLENK